MTNLDNQFSLNRILLLTIGLWPQKSKLARLHSICCFTILITFILFQLTTFMTSELTIHLVIQILSPTSAFTAVAIMYNSFYNNSETIKSLIEQLQHIYDSLRDNNEIAIVERYGNYAKRYTVLLTVAFIGTMMFAISLQLWYPNSYNIKKRQLHLPLMIEYFVDQKKYFYFIHLHVNTALCLILMTFVSTLTMFITYFQIICAMLQIARFSEYLTSKFEISFMFLIIFGVISVTLNIFRIFQNMSWKYAEDLALCFILVLFSTVYMFLCNLIGQQVIDHNNHVFVTAYRIQWYLTPIRIQKLILFLLQRGNKTFKLSIGGLFIASIQCFATLMNASISYFTLMYSVGI